MDQKREKDRFGAHAFERVFLLASPFILGIGNTVMGLFHIPWISIVILFVACIDLLFLSVRSSVHILVSFFDRRFSRAALFLFIAIPTTAIVMYASMVGSAVQEHISVNNLPSGWLQPVMIAMAFVYTIILFPWYQSGRAFKPAKQEYYTTEEGEKRPLPPAMIALKEEIKRDAERRIAE